MTNGALLVGSLSLTLLAAEALTRALSDVGPSLLVVDPVVGKHWLRGFEGDVFVPEARGRIHLRFHSDGFRGPERPKDKPPRVRRIAVLGDSMIAAVATVEERTAVVRLEGLMNSSAPGSRWEVQNFGVSSANTPQELVTYREIARLYHPDVVVVAFNVANDLADNCMCLTRAHRLYFELGSDGRIVERLVTPPAAGLGAWLELHSRFYVWQKMAVARLRANTRAWRERLDVGNEVFRADGAAPVEEAWRITEATLAELKRLVEADGARLLLVLVPAPEEIYEDLWAALQRRAGPDSYRYAKTEPERRLREIGEWLSLRTLDLGPALRAQAPGRDSRAPGEQLYFEGRYHWNDRGNATAATAMAQALAMGTSEDRIDSVVEHR